MLLCIGSDVDRVSSLSRHLRMPRATIISNADSSKSFLSIPLTSQEKETMTESVLALVTAQQGPVRCQRETRREDVNGSCCSSQRRWCMSCSIHIGLVVERVITGIDEPGGVGFEEGQSREYAVVL